MKNPGQSGRTCVVPRSAHAPLDLPGPRDLDPPLAAPDAPPPPPQRGLKSALFPAFGLPPRACPEPLPLLGYPPLPEALSRASARPPDASGPHRSERSRPSPTMLPQPPSARSTFLHNPRLSRGKERVVFGDNPCGARGARPRSQRPSTANSTLSGTHLGACGFASLCPPVIHRTKRPLNTLRDERNRVAAQRLAQQRGPRSPQSGAAPIKKKKIYSFSEEGSHDPWKESDR